MWLKIILCLKKRKKSHLNFKKKQNIASKAFKKYLKESRGESTDEKSSDESEHDGMIALIDMSDPEFDDESSEVSLDQLKAQVHNLSKKKNSKPSTFFKGWTSSCELWVWKKLTK